MIQAFFSFFITICIIPFAYSNTCEVLSNKTVALYNSPECSIVRGVMEYGIIAGSPHFRSSGVCTGSCVEDVMDVFSRIIDEGCDATGEGHSTFIYPVHDNYADFLSYTGLVCRQGECMAMVKHALSNNDCTMAHTPDCFAAVSCDCINEFIAVIGNTSSNFQEKYILDYRADTKLMDTLSEAVTTKACLQNEEELSNVVGPGLCDGTIELESLPEEVNICDQRHCLCKVPGGATGEATCPWHLGRPCRCP